MSTIPYSLFSTPRYGTLFYRGVGNRKEHSNWTLFREREVEDHILVRLAVFVELGALWSKAVNLMLIVEVVGK
jgi:hypothetical protein